MPICIPEYPGHLEYNEGKVWEKLKQVLPDNVYLFTNLYITNNKGEYEADFVVLWPDKGILLIEVKGGKMSPLTGGKWQQISGHVKEIIDLEYKTKQTFYALKRYIEHTSSLLDSSERFGLKKYKNFDLQLMYVFPRSYCPDTMETTGVMRDQIIDQQQLNFIDFYISNFLETQQRYNKSLEDCRLIAQLLTTIHNPSKAWMMARELREEAIYQLTQEQFKCLTTMEDNKSFRIIGPAGSGKTFIALEQARRLSKAGKKVALLVYSVGLSVFLEKVISYWEEDERPAYVGTFHALAREFGIMKPENPDDEWWNIKSADEFLAVAENFGDEDKFDLFVIDEAQDFHGNWWTALSGYFINPEEPQWFIFEDPSQNVFGAEGGKSLNLPTMKLSMNIRNTSAIAELADSLLGIETDHRADTGISPLFIRCKSDQAIHAADDYVESMLEKGWENRDIAIITTGSKHPVQDERMGNGRTEYWQEYSSDDDIFYAHASGIKGLERPVIIVAVNDFKKDGRQREFLYTAITRASHELIIAGDITQLRAVGGDIFANLLMQNSVTYTES